MPEAVRIHENEHPRVLMNVGAALTKRLAELKEQLITNSQNWEDFKQRRGQVTGIMEALDILKEAEDKQG